MRILFLALNWGLGHTSRIIPVISEAERQGATPVFAGTEGQRAIITEAFPYIESVALNGVRIKLSAGKEQIGRLLLKGPELLFHIGKENRKIKKLVSCLDINAIISDNVYGAYHTGIPAIIICHQISVKLSRKFSWCEGTVNKVHRKLISKFNECWIPDFPGNHNLAGELSHADQLPENFNYIGCLSRFRHPASWPGAEKNSVLILLSGPEPQRSILESILVEQAQLLKDNFSFLLVRGKPGGNVLNTINSVAHLDSENLSNAILSSEIIICRSGYSTIMDLVSLKRGAILVPTPGQTEQEYLAEYMSASNLFHMLDQDGFDLKAAIELFRSRGLKQFDLAGTGKSLLTERVSYFLQQVERTGQ
jgi:UDP-N-acetylglucosamine:LPS N-acetylglucosamine transferase